MLRLDKLLQSQGFGSRKHCQHLIHSGQVRLNGVVYRDDRTLIQPANLLLNVAGEDWHYRDKIYIALHKPAGYECSHHTLKHHSVFSLFPAPLLNRGLQSVGRLDQDTTGLLLLTDDGQFLHALTHPRQHVPKRYHIQTSEPITPQQIARLKAGVSLHSEQGLFCADDCQQINERTLSMVIHQGKYHQVKRMIAAVGNHVVHLHRTQIGQLHLDTLQLTEHTWCYLTEGQINAARTSSLPHSDNHLT
ncbi:MAG: pseudouridine synthase [Pseudomonadota bacterium]|nr:pseudouridine synthase [Pseudomonadota bacterium]